MCSRELDYTLLMFSDYALVTGRLLVNVGQATTAERLVRGWRRVDRTVLCRILEDSPLCHPVPEDADVDDLLATYDDVLLQNPLGWRLM